MERIEEQLNFIREIDKEKEIFRQTYLADGSRKENDAEHAWHMAIMTMLLSEYANEKIDVLKTVGMLLIHDIVEIDAGDTYAYDENAKKTQHEKRKRQTAYMDFYLGNRAESCMISGRNLRHRKLLKQNLHGQWITYSQCY